MATKKSKGENNEDHTKTVSILSYLIIGIIWYFVDDEVQNDMTRFHVKQGLVLWIAYIALTLIAGLLFFITRALLSVVQTAMIIWIIIGIVYAASRKKKGLPLIGKFAKKLTF